MKRILGHESFLTPFLLSQYVKRFSLGKEGRLGGKEGGSGRLEGLICWISMGSVPPPSGNAEERTIISSRFAFFLFYLLFFKCDQEH